MRVFLFVAGALAGLAGGILFSTLLTVMAVTESAGATATLMQLLSARMGSGRLLVAWIAVLGVTTVLGGLFAALLGHRARNSATVVGAALFLSLGLWLAEALVGIPLLFGLPPVAGLRDRAVWPVIAPLITLNLLFTSVLAGVFLWLRPRIARERESERGELRRAA